MFKQQSLTQLIEHYLDYIQSSKRIGEDTHVKASSLIQILDALAVRTHEQSVIFAGSEEEDESRLNYQDTYKILTQHFPDYSDYSTVLDINNPAKTDNLAAGDPLDDLADIAVDLSEVLSIAKKYGEAAGQYAFVDSYRIHWGYHLRQLQMYLHCQLTGF
ncbi:MAG: DUF5063 domain-containing protein [Asticcacaulis sp.]|uniref:hypothetical protein n=1 Tax=Asticcacaulis sp. TaxID=1872648 RepID=UPI0039E51ADC